jgi:hypothetical protein
MTADSANGDGPIRRGWSRLLCSKPMIDWIWPQADPYSTPRPGRQFGLRRLLIVVAAIALPLAACPAIESVVLIAWYEIALLITLLAWRRQVRRIEQFDGHEPPQPVARRWAVSIGLILLWFVIPGLLKATCR